MENIHTECKRQKEWNLLNQWGDKHATQTEGQHAWVNPQYLIIIPFSIEKLSVGRPAMFQSLIFTGSPSVPVTEKSSEQGILMLRQALTHCTVCSCLKAAVKAPKYATTPDDTKTSPIRFSNLIPSCFATSVHLWTKIKKTIRFKEIKWRWC